MKKSITPIARHTLLASAALLAIGVTPAGAQPLRQASYNFGLYGLGQTLSLEGYATALPTGQVNSGLLDATVADVRLATQLSNTLGGFGVLDAPTIDGTPISQGNNRIAAIAAGNHNTAAIELGQSAGRIDGGDGVAALVGQLRNMATTRTLVTDSSVSTRVENMPAAQQVLTGNTLVADTTLNQSAATIAGTLPAAAGPSAGVMASIGAGPYEGSDVLAHNSAAVAVTTAQVAVGAGSRSGSGAAVVNSRVELEVAQQSYAPPPVFVGLISTPVTLVPYLPYPQNTQVSAALEVAGNTISAGSTGNRATSGIAAQDGAAAVSQSLAVSNTQANIGSRGNDLVAVQSIQDGLPGASAQVVSSGMIATVHSLDGGRSDLTGSLAVTGNTVTADATGNAAGGARAAGNSIVVSATNVDIAGFGGVATAGSSNGRTQGMTGAGIVLANAQSNQDELLLSGLAYSGIGAIVDNVAGQGSVAIDRNLLGASATGNTAGNLVQVDATRIAASVAASNSQGNVSTEIGAVAANVVVLGSLGTYGAEVNGSTSVSSNAVRSAATGNAAETRVALGAAQFAGMGQAGSARATLTGDGTANAAGDVSAANAQSNTGGSIVSGLSGARVDAEFVGAAYPGYAGEVPLATTLRGASASVDGNVLRSTAVANDASTGIALAGGVSSASVALANNQQNLADVGSTIRYSGVGVSSGRVVDSTVALTGNTIAASGVGNRADNSVSAAVTTLQPAQIYVDGPTIVGAGFNGSGGASTDRSTSSAAAILSLSSTQASQSTVDVRNQNEGPMARVDIVGANPISFVGNDANNGAASGSSVAVKGNVGSAAATGNQVTNALAVDAGTASVGTPLAALSNMQLSNAYYGSTAITGGSAGNGVAIGVRYDGGLSASTIAVSDNVVSASNLGNTAGNTLSAQGNSLAGTQGGAQIEATPWNVAVRNDLSLANQQVDNSGDRLAQTRNVAVGIDDQRGAWSGVSGTDLSVTGNRNIAEARNNNAVNTVAATGFSSLGANAGLANSQDSNTNVTAKASGAARIQARDTGVSGATLAVTGNATQALAVANSAANGMVVDAQQVLAPLSSLDTLQGWDSYRSGAFTAVLGESSLTSTAQFAVANGQAHQGAVTATATGGARINMDGSGAWGSTASVTGNAVAAIAQSNSADNSLALSAAAATGVTGAVASTQQAGGAVSATAQAQAGGRSFTVLTAYAGGSQLTVANNTFRASAGQNEAFNGLTVSATALTGAFGGIGPDGAMSSSADYAVLNRQVGSGNVTATATPGLIGMPAGSSWGGNLAVTGNEVSAMANVNQSRNTLEIATQGTLVATAQVANAQSTQGGLTSAVVGDRSPTFIGASAYGLDYGSNSVTGNALTAAAGGNTTANVLNAGSGAGGASRSTASFQVTNQQDNASAMNAAVQNATIGMALGFPHDVNGTLGAYSGIGYGSLNGSTAAIQGNQVQAGAYGNSASNAIGLTAAGASANLANSQSNTASINASVANVTIGIGGGQAAGSNVSVTGNSVSAQAVGNSATNVIRLK